MRILLVEGVEAARMTTEQRAQHMAAQEQQDDCRAVRMDYSTCRQGLVTGCQTDAARRQAALNAIEMVWNKPVRSYQRPSTFCTYTSNSIYCD